MTREEISKECINALQDNQCILTLLATGTGKSKIAIDCLNHTYNNRQSNPFNVLIAVDRKVQIVNFKQEMLKWECQVPVEDITFCCYASLHKYEGTTWDMIILDECHHVGSDSRLHSLKKIHVTHNIIGLSATVSRELQAWFKRRFKTTIVSCTTQDAIESNILPDPTIYLLPLILDNTQPTELFELNKKTPGDPIFGNYKDLWALKRSKRHAFVKCTKKQYLAELNGLVQFYKNKSMGGNQIMKNLWLRACADRLNYLAKAKNDLIKDILSKLKSYRTITFCTDIEQSEVLGKNCIHSKNKKATDTLEAFNNKKIKHITACNMLNESVNLTDCKYGIFANINASETIQIQRVGRSLRHKSPILIIPFYRDTREEEIVRKWMENYNKDLIKIIQDGQGFNEI